MVRCKISLWLQEFEDEYQLFTGWEQAAEDWAAFVRLWDAEEPNWDQVKYQLDRVEWMQANIACAFPFSLFRPDFSLLRSRGFPLLTLAPTLPFPSGWSLLRRSHILLFTSLSLPSTLAGIEELELRDLVKLADFPDFFDDIEQKWVPASHVLDMAKRKGAYLAFTFLLSPLLPSPASLALTRPCRFFPIPPYPSPTASRPPPAPPDPLIDIFALHLPRAAPTPLHPHTPLDPPSDFHVRTVSTDLTPKEIAEVVRRKQHSSSSSDTTKVEAGLTERKGRRGSDA